MGRPREFDQDQALDKAMQVFWAMGYEAASLTDLTKAMGLSKSSFYETFGSKHGLFTATIDRYTGTISTESVGALSEDVPARVAIAEFFYAAVELISEGDRRGCFLSNCASELGAQDAEVSERVGAGFNVIEEGLYRAVQRGQRDGDIRDDRDPRALARFLGSSLSGLSVMAKAGRGRDALLDVAEIALTALD